MKNRFINTILTLVVIACFAGAGYMGWLFWQENHTTSEATEDTRELRAAVVQTVSKTTAAAENTAAVTGTPSAEETPLAVLPYEEAPEETPYEPEAEADDDDAQLLVIMHNREAGYDVLGTPVPSEAAVETPEAIPDAKETESVPPTDAAVQSTAKPDTANTSAEPATEAPSPMVENTIEVTPDIPAKETMSPVAALTASPVAADVSTETLQPDTPETVAPTDTPEPTATATAAPTDTPEPTASPVPTATPYVPLVGSSVNGELKLTVDFSALMAINEDVRAWIYQEGTEINYPIVQAEDNDYYLTHLFNRSTNKTGALFMDYGNSPYFMDMLTFVYGHNRKDNAMFASIPSYKNQEYFDAHPTMELITPYENYLLEIFALVRINTDQTAIWHVKSFSGRDAFLEYTGKLLEMSYIDTGVVPEWGDQLIALATCTNEVRKDRYVLYARMRPIVYQNDTESQTVTKIAFDSKQGTSRMVNVPGRGMMQYYAQNDPVWNDLIYESKSTGEHRNFGGSGCGPTSMAIILANMIDDEYFWYLSYYSGLDTGLGFCEDSVNQYFCKHTHSQYRLEQPSEYRRYLPIAVGSFCTGNNCWKEAFRSSSGTGSGMFARIAQIFGLRLFTTKDKDVLVESLKKGGMAVANVGGGNPYTGGGHYMAVVAADDEYLYVMDPFLKENYSRTDKYHVINVLEPGLLQLKISNWARLDLIKFYVFEKND